MTSIDRKVPPITSAVVGLTRWLVAKRRAVTATVAAATKMRARCRVECPTCNSQLGFKFHCLIEYEIFLWLMLLCDDNGQHICSRAYLLFIGVSDRVSVLEL
jgi:hypothetical protein